MPKVAYITKRFNTESQAVITRANAIIDEYAAQGFDLTLRQLYYQFVARGLIPNRDSEYKKLGSIVNDARLAGLIDWNRIQDRTRFLRGNQWWHDARDLLRERSEDFRLDMWQGQEYRPEVWIEKDALVGVIQSKCNELDANYFSCRGYTSQSEMWTAAMRIVRNKKNMGQTTYILHLGDHDPSGIDMSRDIEDRLTMFCEAHLPNTKLPAFIFQRIALNMDQVQQYDPPPNPAKLTDVRSTSYISRYGDDSWELDALEPQVINDLIENGILEFRDDDAWARRQEEQDKIRARLAQIAERWYDVEEFLDEDVA